MGGPPTAGQVGPGAPMGTLWLAFNVFTCLTTLGKIIRISTTTSVTHVGAVHGAETRAVAWCLAAARQTDHCAAEQGLTVASGGIDGGHHHIARIGGRRDSLSWTCTITCTIGIKWSTTSTLAPGMLEPGAGGQIVV